MIEKILMAILYLLGIYLLAILASLIYVASKALAIIR